MTAASTSDARKRNTSPVDPVEVVARAACDPGSIFPRHFDAGWYEGDKRYESLPLWQARAIVQALRENGFTL